MQTLNKQDRQVFLSHQTGYRNSMLLVPSHLTTELRPIRDASAARRGILADMVRAVETEGLGSSIRMCHFLSFHFHLAFCRLK